MVYQKLFAQSPILLLSAWIISQSDFKAEHGLFACILFLLATLGTMVVVSATSWVLLYIGLELIALPTYVMCVMIKKKSRVLGRQG